MSIIIIIIIIQEDPYSTLKKSFEVPLPKLLYEMRHQDPDKETSVARGDYILLVKALHNMLSLWERCKDLTDILRKLQEQTKLQVYLCLVRHG